jgi:hypothetical protein
MKTSILKALIFIINNKLFNTDKAKSSYQVRINNSGVDFEELIKKALICRLNATEAEEINLQAEYFSYIANQNNPPDLIIKNGDAIEIKKIESFNGDISLNSSFPKNKLQRNSPLLTKACINCEDSWEEKDIFYIISSIQNNNIYNLWFIHGECFCADPLVYLKVKNTISSGIKDLGLSDFETNEIAKIKKIDPLGITDLRVRGMWNIKHPNKVFNYLLEDDKKSSIKLLLTKQKWLLFNKEERNELLLIAKIKEVKIPNPNNLAELINAIFLEYDL